MREVAALRDLRHSSVVSLLEVIPRLDGTAVPLELNLVLEYMPHDLAGLLQKDPPDPGRKKDICVQILGALAFIHSKGYVHRDVKASNVLINRQGEVKLADFGLACRTSHERIDAQYLAVTLAYRPPELLWACKASYGVEIDLWSVGCLIAEIFMGQPLFRGRNEVVIQTSINRLCGTPSNEELLQLRLSGLIPGLPSALADAVRQKHPSHQFGCLVESLVRWLPSRRLSAAQAARHPFFTEEAPPPRRLRFSPVSHDIEMRELTHTADLKCPPPSVSFGFEKVDAFIKSHTVFTARSYSEPVATFRPIIE